jgi:hypothetical protein
MRNLFLLAVIAVCLYGFATRKSNAFGSSANSVERMKMELEAKEDIQRQVKQHIESAKANPPMCGGRPMKFSLSADTEKEIAERDREIAELREKIRRAE